ncbi:MAG: efflux RND transporter permease subunit, partial [Gemmatimonadaceae bacterium]|nr:efflux RND transporter permease subunit [Acetobacteraceae bacterium]
VLFVPLLGATLLPERAKHGAEHEVYGTRMYRAVRGTVGWCVRRRWAVIGLTVVAFVVAIVGFTRVPQQFFPASDRLEVIIDLRLPEGGAYSETSRTVERVEEVLAADPGVRSWAAYTGSGSPRFFLASQPELENANFGQIIANMHDVPAREALLAKLHSLSDAGNLPDVRMRSGRLELGPPVGYPVQFRVVGPDPSVLRRVADEVRVVMRANPHLRNVSDSWGNAAKSVQVNVDADKARVLGLSTEDVSTALQTVLQGATLTLYREGTELIPVIARAWAEERGDLAALSELPVQGRGRSVPLGQVAQVTYGLEAPTVWRRNRTPMLLVRGDIADTTQAPVVTAQVLPALDGIKARLPAGYRIETAGAVEESAKGQASINAVMPLMLFATVALLMVQLQSFSRVFMVVLTAPLGLIGVAAALLVTGAPFGFVATLGFIALAGTIMRNAVILVDQIETDARSGMPLAEAIVEATVRRSRPIVLTAAAAILALVPLAFSVFWGPMAISIMGGLVSATALTLLFVPALYAAWHRLPRGQAARKPIGLTG